MKIFFSSFAAALSMGLGASARSMSSSDLDYWRRQPLGPAMWHFGADGVTIYSEDGGRVLKEIRSDVGVCPEAEQCSRFTGECAMSSDCGYNYLPVSDGHRYVWAINHAWTYRLDVFDIDTGDYAGYVPTCESPLEADYFPPRREMWIRCAGTTEEEPGYVDVVSTNSLSTNHGGVDLPVGPMGRQYGFGIEVDVTLGNYGYSAPYNMNFFAQIDLSSRKIVANHTFPPEVHSTYDVQYSPANRHIYGKARVCCTCGSPGADKESCGRGAARPVTVLTGPSADAGALQNGTCGSGCEGSAADPGVFEFDTVSKTFLGFHNGPAENGATPYASPDGKYVMLTTHDGGATTRILKAGANGEASTVAATIPLDMAATADATNEAVVDVAFIEDGTRNFIVIAGSANNEAAFIDMDDDFRMVKVAFSNNPEPTSEGRRNVEWVVGTDFVWIDGAGTEEMYVLEVGETIDTARVVRTLTDIKGGWVIHVENHARQETVQSFMAAEASTNSTTQAVAIAALIVGCVAFCAAVWLGATRTVAAAADAPKGAARNNPELSSVAGNVSLGSKQVA